jgi:hypothetical protein
MPVPLHQAPINDPSASQSLSIRGRDARLGLFAHTSSAQAGRTQFLQSSSEMRITARRLNRREHTTAAPRTGRPRLQRDSDSDSEMTLIDPAIEQDDEPQVQVPQHGSTSNVAEPIPPHLTSSPRFESAKKQESNTFAQRELQHMSEEVAQDAQENPFAQDILGIDMLLQAAKLIEDRERGQQMQQESVPERDSSMQSDASNSAGPGSQSHHSNGNESRFQDASEVSKLDNKRPPPPPGFVLTIPDSAEAVPLPASPPLERKRRRSERVATLNPIYYRPSKRAKTEQAKSTSKVSSRTVTSNPATGPNTGTDTNLHTPAQNAIVRARIKAIRDHSTALARGRSRPLKWSPLVKSYLEEQRIRHEKTMRWLEAQDSSEEEGYDHGVEGGVWIESSGSEAEGNGFDDAKEKKKGKERGVVQEGTKVTTPLQSGNEAPSPDVHVHVETNMSTQPEIRDSQDDVEVGLDVGLDDGLDDANDDADDEHESDRGAGIINLVDDDDDDDDDDEPASQTADTIIVISSSSSSSTSKTKNQTPAPPTPDIVIDLDSANADIPPAPPAAGSGYGYAQARERERDQNPIRPTARTSASNQSSLEPRSSHSRRRLVRGHRRSSSSSSSGDGVVALE